jgi:Tfp pilus assembly protein PilF
MRAFLTFLAVAFTAFAGETFAGDMGELDRAQNFYSHTEYAAAISILKQMPESPKSLELLGQSYFMDGEYRKATDTLERAASLAPNDSDIQTWLGRAYGRRAETAFPLQAIGYASKSRQAFEKAVKLDPHNREALNDLFEFYVEAPGFMGGGIDRAKSLLPAIAQDDPAEIYFARARIAEKKDQLSDAEAQLRRAVDLAPHQVGRLLDLAKFLYREGRFEEGDSYFQKAEQASPNAPRILFARASAYIKSKRNLPEAASLLKRYIASNNLTPDDPPRSEAMKLLKQAQGS